MVLAQTVMRLQEYSGAFIGLGGNLMKAKMNVKLPIARGSLVLRKIHHITLGLQHLLRSASLL
jgi:hypothetical protein